MIEITGVSRSFGRVKALSDVSLSVEAGSLVGLLGPNGAGKSTLVRLICALLPPERGEVRVGGEPVLTAPERVRRRIGLVTDTPALYPQMTAGPYLAFFAQLCGIPADEARRRAQHWIERLGLTPHAKKPLQALSRGNRQRVAIARALIHEPDILLLDEPSAGLDPESARQVEGMVADLRGEGRAILLCSHDLPEVERLADRVAVIRRGRILLDEPLGAKARINAVVAAGGAADGATPEAVTSLPWQELGVHAHDVEIRRIGETLSVAIPLVAQRAPEVARLLIGGGFALLELGPERDSLEKLYFEVMQSAGA